MPLRDELSSDSQINCAKVSSQIAEMASEGSLQRQNFPFLRVNHPQSSMHSLLLVLKQYFVSTVIRNAVIFKNYSAFFLCAAAPVPRTLKKTQTR